MDHIARIGLNVLPRSLPAVCWMVVSICGGSPHSPLARGEAFDSAALPVAVARVADDGQRSILAPPHEIRHNHDDITDIIEDSSLNDSAGAAIASSYGHGLDLPDCTSMDAADAGFADSPPGPCTRCARWEGQVDALLLWQGNIPSRPLFVDPISGAVGLNANQAQTPLSVGPRFGLRFKFDANRAVEGNYFIVRSFSGQAPKLPGNYYENNLAGNNFGPVDAAQLLSSANIQSAELNWRRCGDGPLTWISGFRWVEWNQQMQINEMTSPPYAFASQAGNDLYGGQLGVDLCLWNNGHGPITVNALAKTGLYYNNAFQRTGAGEPGGATPPTVAGAVADQVSCFSEVGVTGQLRIWNWLSWRAGYTLFWLNGVAIPTAQLSATNLSSVPPTATINTGGSVLLHGVTTGLEARW